MQPRNTIFREIICNEQITNLLDPSKRNLQIREDVKSGVYVENLTEEYEDVTQVLVKVCFVCHVRKSVERSFLFCIKYPSSNVNPSIVTELMFFLLTVLSSCIFHWRL
ncbi:uncharacterized protein LOC116125709 isoform X1 [Pistacia vera]|uniref:uncharacterized protein LOC116125709 isoform X1 n=1 Tax=Pistacia vera TaxID=55513 RepID=UPI001262EFFA|nr:uncharacterized protein LOC116125709 isoform X1 [Pistacia vera]